MAHPLEKRIAALRNRLRRLLAVYGLGWLVTAGLAAALAMGLLDYLLHFQDRGIRVIASLSVWGVVLWAGYRFCSCRRPRGCPTPSWPAASSAGSRSSTTAWPAPWSSSISRKTTRVPARPPCEAR